MNELTKLYGEAVFGKEAAEMWPPAEVKGRVWELRQAIEASADAENRKRELARKAIAYARERATAAARKRQSYGMLKFLQDAGWAAIPGLKIEATNSELTKTAADSDDEGYAGRLFDILHGATAATGAGAGIALQRGHLGGRFGAKALSALTPDVAKTLATEARLPKDIAEILRNIAATPGQNIALAAQRDAPIPGMLRKGLTRVPLVGKRFKNIGTAAGQARRRLSTALNRDIADQLDSVINQIAGARQGKGLQELVRRRGELESTGQQLRKFMRHLPEYGSRARKTALTGLKLKGVKIPLPRGVRGGALGALALSSPFIIWRLLKTFGLRARGGSGAQEATTRARDLLAEAEEIKKQRELDFAELAKLRGK